MNDGEGRDVRMLRTLTVASAKMFFRQREAILWTFLLPLFMVTLFAFVRFEGSGTVALGVAGPAGEMRDRVSAALRAITALRVTEGPEAGELRLLRRGERDLVLVLPADLAPGTRVKAYTGDGRPAEAQIALLAVESVLNGLSPAPPEATLLAVEPVRSRRITYLDFLLPGVLSMAIMQMGVFGVAFSFVSLKKRGILRRLSATPVRRGDFILAQVLMRLLVVLLQVGLLAGAGVWVFGLHLAGNPLALAALAVPGAIVFLAIGFTLAGIARSEDQVAPMANAITLPMLLLSGVFFDRANLPGAVHAVTGLFPLTFLADGMRSVAVDGAALPDLLPQIAGLLLWCIVACGVAVRFFRWE